MEMDTLPYERLIIPLFIGAIAKYKHWLTFSGAILGTFFGTITILSGWTEALCLLAFFLLGTLSTKLSNNLQRQRLKQNNNTEDKFVVVSYNREANETEEKKGRTAGQVFATAGIPTFLCFLLLLADVQDQRFSYLNEEGSRKWLKSLIVSYFACSCADTFASEFGVLSRRRPLLLSTLKPVPRGTDGAISLEGTLAALLGGAIIGLTAAFDPFLNGSSVFCVLKYSLVGFIGSMLDSAFGCFLQPVSFLSKHPEVND